MCAPVELAVAALLRNVRTLLLADTAQLFMIINFGHTELAVELKGAFLIWINARHSHFIAWWVSAQGFIKIWEFEFSAVFWAPKQISHCKCNGLTEWAAQSARRIIMNYSVSSFSELGDGFSPLSLKDKLEMAIFNNMKCKNKTIFNVSKDLSKKVCNEIAVREMNYSWNIFK
jgi:hypothetical protein